MNDALEIHDANLAGLERVGSDAVVHLEGASVHRSEGRPGVDPGSVWVQDADPILSEAVVGSLPSRLPCTLSDGTLSVGGAAWENDIPLPMSAPGPASLSLATSGGEALVVRGSRATIVPRGGPRYLEPFPGMTEG